MSELNPAPDHPKELLPCPFCGGSAELVKGDNPPCFIRCPNPQCGDGSDWIGFDGPFCMTKEKAVEAWNRRAHPPALVDSWKEMEKAIRCLAIAVEGPVYGSIWEAWVKFRAVAFTPSSTEGG